MLRRVEDEKEEKERTQSRPHTRCSDDFYASHDSFIIKIIIIIIIRAD